MTYVEVLVQEGTNGEKKIVGISSVGHADYAESGKDVICAAISMAMHILENGVRRNLGIPCTIKNGTCNNHNYFFKCPGEFRVV